VLGEPRGPKGEMRMSPQTVAEIVEPAGFHIMQVIALFPYHYGALFETLAPHG
jgi:hypothetical protein